MEELDPPPIQPKTESYIANLENARHAALFNSGVSAISALLSLCESSSNVIVPDDFYSGTRYLMNKCFGERLNYKVIKSESLAEDLERYLNEGNVSMVIVETPTNPLL
jgi:cystathionine gamma-synthase